MFMRFLAARSENTEEDYPILIHLGHVQCIRRVKDHPELASIFWEGSGLRDVIVRESFDSVEARLFAAGAMWRER